MPLKYHLPRYYQQVRVLALILVSVTALAADPLATARKKLGQVQSAQLVAGTRIFLSAPELAVWVQSKAAEWASYGATNIRFKLGTGRATAYADIDFLKARKAATGQDAGWLLRNLFSGRKPVSVTARLTSAGGRGRVDVDRVEVNGVAVQGVGLEMLIQDVVKPNFPDARVGEWFPLDYRLDRFTVAPGGVNVVVGK